MARINRAELTKLEIIRLASKKFLEDGYSQTPVKAISKELNMSPGNLTFHFPTKDHLLAELVDLLCDFQWKMMEKEADEGYSSVMAICLELMAMAAMCEEDAIAKDFYLSAYSSPLCLEIIRKNDVERAKKVFQQYCPDWTEQHFAEAEVLVSGIEYATLMTAGDPVSLETRIRGALVEILRIYNVPDELRKQKIEKLMAMDYRKIGRQILKEFKKHVEKATEQAFIDLVTG